MAIWRLQGAPLGEVGNAAIGHAVQAGWPALPETEELLVEGGDDRIALSSPHGVNRYGCGARPDPEVCSLGSSTASVISPAGFAAAERMRRRLLLATREAPADRVYAGELERIRRDLIRLCGLSELHGLQVVFGASGTDLHLIARALLAGNQSTSAGSALPALPALIVNVEANETGSGVPAALAGRHFSARAALGRSFVQGSAISNDTADTSVAAEVISVPLRLADGSARSASLVDAEVMAHVNGAASQGRRVLLILADQTKTGLVAPSPDCAAMLRRRHSPSVEVLVDACQLRLAPTTLRTYLEAGFLVATTGSKFIGGPSFSGALLIPSETARGLRGASLASLTAHSARADWPAGWAGAACLDKTANFGLLLRWEAALGELRAFRALDESEVTGFLGEFARAVESRLASDPAFEALPVPRLDRGARFGAPGWDQIQTIFPFVLRRPDARGNWAPLGRDQTEQIYRGLRSHEPGGGDLRVQLGQPVPCGERAGVPVSALRLCASARLAVEALALAEQHAASARGVIARALAALDELRDRAMASTT